MIGFKLGKLLSADASIRDKVEHNNFTGIYLDRAPQGAPYPRIIIAIIGGNPDYELGGEISDIKKMVQLDIDSYNRYEANEIGELVRTAIGFITTPTTWDDTTIHSAVIENERDQAFPPSDDSDRWIFRRSIDWRIAYER